jgi:hypothetical protein
MSRFTPPRSGSRNQKTRTEKLSQFINFEYFRRFLRELTEEITTLEEAVDAVEAIGGEVKKSDLKVNLDALPREEGSLYWAIDLAKLFYDDGSTLVEVGPGAGGGGSGHTIQDEGTPLPDQPNLNFEGILVTATDDAGSSATKVTINPNRIQRTYVQITADIAGGLLIPNAIYEITDVQSQFLGFLPPEFTGLIYATSFVTTALSPTELATDGLILSINGDFQGVGDYSGVTGTVGNLLGNYYKEYEISVNITSHSGLTDRPFRIEGFDEAAIENNTLGITAGVSQVITPPPVDPTATPYTVTCRVIMEDAQNQAGQFQVGDLIFAGQTTIQGTVTAVSDTWTPLVNDIVIWNKVHWRNLTGSVGDFPTIDAVNWELISDLSTPATAEATGHILEWDACRYDLENDFPVAKRDKRGNYVWISYGWQSQFFPVSLLNTFPFGNDKFYSNEVSDTFIQALGNFRGTFGGNKVHNCSMSLIFSDGSPNCGFISNTYHSGSISGILLAGGSFLSYNEVGSGDIDEIALFDGSNISNNTVTKTGGIQSIWMKGSGSSIIDCLASGYIQYIELDATAGEPARIQGCFVGTNAQIQGLRLTSSSLNECSIESCHIEERAVWGSNNTAEAQILTSGTDTHGVTIRDVHMRAGCFMGGFQMSNKDQIYGLEFGVSNFFLSFGDLDFTLDPVNNQLRALKCVSGYSNIPVKLTPSAGVLNFDDGVHDYRFAGFVYIDSVTDETITTLQNFMGLFPVRIYGQNGRTHTLENGYETSGQFSLTEGDYFEMTNEKDFAEFIVPQQDIVATHDTVLEITRHRSRTGGMREGWLKARLLQSNILLLGSSPYQLKAQTGSSVVLWATKAVAKLKKGGATPYTAGGGGTLNMAISNVSQAGIGALLQDSEVTLGNTSDFYTPFEIINGINLVAGDDLSIWLQGGIDPTGGDAGDELIIDCHYVEVDL